MKHRIRKPHVDRGTLHLYNPISDQTEPVVIEAFGWSTSTRKIKPSHSDHMIGYCGVPIGGKNIAVQYESGLECFFLEWIGKASDSLTLVAAQPVTAYGSFNNGLTRRYTCDFLVEMSQVPPRLKWLGFECTTLVEIKPSLYIENWIVQCKAELMRLATGLPVVILDEDVVGPEAVELKEIPHVH